jgi:beta-phosphoglucomutase-like phosphatase (HAD superfamily)
MAVDPAQSWGVEDSLSGALALQAAGFLPLVTQPSAVPPTGAVLYARTLWPLDIPELFAIAASRPARTS